VQAKYLIIEVEGVALKRRGQKQSGTAAKLSSRKIGKRKSLLAVYEGPHAPVGGGPAAEATPTKIGCEVIPWNVAVTL
jgi:hypothetical protein